MAYSKAYQEWSRMSGGDYVSDNGKKIHRIKENPNGKNKNADYMSMMKLDPAKGSSAYQEWASKTKSKDLKTPRFVLHESVERVSDPLYKPRYQREALENLARQTVDDRARQQRPAFQNQAAQVQELRDAMNRNNYDYISRLKQQQAELQARRTKQAQNRTENRKDSFVQVPKTEEPFGKKSTEVDPRTEYRQRPSQPRHQYTQDEGQKLIAEYRKTHPEGESTQSIGGTNAVEVMQLRQNAMQYLADQEEERRKQEGKIRRQSGREGNITDETIKDINPEDVGKKTVLDRARDYLRYDPSGSATANFGDVLYPSLRSTGNPMNEDLDKKFGIDRMSSQNLTKFAAAGSLAENNPLMAAEQASKGSPIQSDRARAYTMMTPEEKRNYNAILALNGLSKAEEYHDALLDDINARIAKDIYEGGTKEAGTASKALYTLASGLGQGIRGIGEVGNVALGTSNTKATPVSQNLAAEIRRDENNSKVQNVVYDLAQSTGNMLPGIVASAFLGPQAGSAVFAFSQAGNSYREAINAGESTSTATMYSLQQGIDEMTTNFLLGGIQAFGGGAIKRVIQDIGGDAFTKALDRVCRTPAGKQILNRVIDYMSDMGSEAAQEYVQFYTENWTQALLGMKDQEGNPVVANLNPLDPNALYSALLGALNAGALNVPQIAGRVSSASRADVSDAAATAEYINRDLDITNYTEEDLDKAIRLADIAEDIKQKQEQGQKVSALEKTAYISAAEDVIESNSFRETEESKREEAYKTARENLAEGFGEEGKKAFNENIAEENRIEAYKPFAAYYNYGYHGTPVSRDMEKAAFQTMSSEQIDAAMRAGAADANRDHPIEATNRVQKAVEGIEIKAVKAGNIDTSSINMNRLTSQQRFRVQYAGALISKGLGLDVRFIESRAEGGVYRGINGSFQVINGRPTVTLDVNAGMNRISDWTGELGDIQKMLPIISHELTHYLEKTDSAMYKEISDAVITELSKNRNYTKGLTINQMISAERKRMDRNETRYDESGKMIPHSNDDAMREIVARACEDMLNGNETATKAFEGMSKRTKKYVWDHVKKVFDNIQDFFAQMLGNYESRSAEAKAIRQNMEEFERIRGMWQEALGVATETLNKGEPATSGENARAENAMRPEELKNIPDEDRQNYIAFKKELMRADGNRIKRGGNMTVMEYTPQILIDAGLEDKRIFMSVKHYREIIHEEVFDWNKNKFKQRRNQKEHDYHGLTRQEVSEAPIYLNNPAMIIDSDPARHPDSVIVIADSRDYRNRPIMIALKTDGTNGYNLDTEASNFLKTMYGKDGDFEKFLTDSINSNRILYINKEKSQDLFKRGGRQLPSVLNNLSFDQIIHQSNNVVKSPYPSKATRQQNPTRNLDANTLDSANDFTDGVAQDGITLKGESKTQFSERTYENGGREFLKMWLETQSDLSKEDRQDVVGQIDSVYDLMQKIKKEGGVEGYTAWSNVENRDGQLTVIVPNGEYPLNVDFSTVCKKRKALDHILNTMIQREDLTAAELAGKDIVRLQQIIKEEGLEIACALCFVDSKRYRIGDWADRITAGKDTGNSHQYGFNELLDSLIPEGSKLKIDEHNFTGRDIKQPKGKLLKDAPDSQLDFTLVDNLIKNSNKSSWNYKVATAIRENPEIRSYLNSAELLSSIGFDPIKAQSPAIYNLINNAGGSSKPKLSFSEVPYLNDILMNQQMKPEQAYKVGGVRIQSFSDFMANMVFDYVQMVGELQAKKLPAHAYTKESSFVALFGKTGIKINMSLVPKATTMTQEEVKDYIQKFETKKARQNAYKELKKTAGLDADGNYIWEDETFPYEVAMHFQADPEYAKNCGTIAVGISDAHIRKLLADPTIQMVIPYHSSGINNTVAKMRGIDLYTDYTKQQTTKNRATGKSITASQNTFDFYGVLKETGDPKATAQAYLDWCKENNFIPKFEKFTKGPGSENYYKLLIDFRVYDENGNYAPQGAVQAIYPEPALMKEYIQNGYTYTAADGTVYHNGGLRTAQETSDKLMSKTDEIIRKYNEGKTGKKQYSSRDTEYLTAVEEDDTNKAQRMVRDAAKEIPTIAKDKRGFPLHLYHGTPDFGFTEFVDEKHKVPFIYTSTKSQVSAHYAGDKNYAFTRPIGRKYRTGNTTKDIIENAKWVLQSDLKVMTTEQKSKMYNEVREEAIKIADKLDELFPGYEVSKNWDDEVNNSISTIMDIFWTMRDADQYDFDKEEGANYWKETIEQDIRWRENNLPKVKEYYENNYEKLGEEEKSFLSYLLGYEAGDVAVDIQYGAANVATDGDVLIDSTGKKVYSPAKLKEYMDRIHEIGAYDLYGDLGGNPYEIDCEGAQFWAIKVPDMGDGYYGTDQLCKWAYEHGYTSVIMRNIYDYGDKADNYVFFDSSQLKSADPVTYDDNGDVIPLSERFNSETSDIRYSSREDDAFSLWQDVVSEKNDAAGRDSVFFLDEDDPTKVTYQQQEYFEEMSKTNDTIKAMNAALHQAIGEGKKVDVDKFAEEQAKKLRRSYGSKTAKGDLTEAIRSLCEKMNAAIQKDANDIAVVASNIGREVMQGIVVEDDTMRKQYPNLKRELKTYRILPGEKVRADMAAAYDSYEAFRRRAFGNLTIVGDDAGDFVRVDSVYQELNEKYPELFPDDIQNESEQMLRIMEVAQEVSGKKVTYTEAWGTSQDNLDEMSYMIGQDILNDYYKAAGTPAFGGVLESVRNDLIKQHKADMKEAFAEKNRTIRDLRERLRNAEGKDSEKIKARLEALRNDKNNQLARMQQRYEQKMEKIRERRIDADARTRLLKAAQRLARMKGGPDFEARKEALVGDLDLFAKGIGKNTKEKLEQLKTEADQLAAQDENYRLIGYEKARRAFERLSKKRIADMTGPEVAELTERIVELTYMQQATKRILDKELQVQVATAGKRVIAQQKLTKGINDRNVIGSTFGRYALNMLNPTRAMARLDGYQRDGVLTKLGKALNDGQTRQNEFTMRASKKFNAFLDAHPDLVRTWYQTDIDTGYKGEDGKPIYINKGMRISLYLHSLNYQNRNHIARAGIEIPDAKLYQKGKYAEAYRYQERLKLQPTDIKRITDGMTADEKAFANLAKEFLNVDTKDAINETSMVLNGTYKATVDNYFPIRTDPNFVMGDITGLIQDGTIEGWGALKERKEGAAKPVLLEDVAVVLQRQTTNTAKYYGLAIPVRDFNKVIKWQETTGGTSVGEAINKTWGKTGTDYIRNVLRDIQTGAPGAEGPGAKLFSSLKSTYAGTVLNWNIGVSIKQSASAPFAAVVLDTKSIAKAFAPNNFFRKADLEYMDSITPWSYMRRQGMSGTEMGEVYKPKNFVQKSEKLQKFKQKTNFIQAVDVWTTNRLFLATEYYVQDHFPNLEKRGPEYNRKVAELYNDMLQRTQPSYDVMQRNAFLRSDSPATKIFGMFKTQTFNMGGEVIDAWGRLTAFEKMHKDKQVSDAQLKKVRGQFGRTVGATIASQLMLTALGVLAKAVYHNMKNYRDDKGEVTPESTFMRAIYEFMTSFSGMTMGGSEAQSFFLALTGKEKWYDMEYPGLSTINDFMTNSTKVTENFRKACESGWKADDAEKFRNSCAELAMSAAILGRIPADNIYKLANALYLHVQDIKNGDFGKFEAGESLLGLRDSSVTKDQYAQRAAAAYAAGDTAAGDQWAEKTTNKKLQAAMYGDLGIDEDSSKAMVAYVKDGGNATEFERGQALAKELEEKDIKGDEVYAYVVGTKDYTNQEKIAWFKSSTQRTDSKKYTAWKDAGYGDWDFLKYRSDLSRFSGDGKQDKIVNYIKTQTADTKKRKALWMLAGYKESSYDKNMN